MIDIISREAWGAKPATWHHYAKERRVHIISMCFGKEHKLTKRSTIYYLRWMQHYSMWILDFHDIRYNYQYVSTSFMIGEDGTIYEGRGWTEIPFLPDSLKDLEKNSLLLGIVGPMKVTKLPQTMEKAKNDLIRYGIKSDYIQENFRRRVVEKNKEKDRELPELKMPEF